MRHRGLWRRPVPMLLTRREPDDIPWPDFLNRPAFALRPAAAGRNDESLPQRMRMPGGAGTRLERHTGTDHARRIGRLKQRIDADRAGKVVGRSLAGRLRAAAFDLHGPLSF